MKVGQMLNEPRSQRWRHCRLECCDSDGAISRNVAVAATTLRRYDVAARKAATLQCCGAAALQLAMLRHYGAAALLAMLRHCGAAARDVTTLRRYSLRCCDATALQFAMLQRCGTTVRDNVGWQRTTQRWRATLELARTAASSDGRRRRLKFLFCFFFYSTVSKREREQGREKRGRASKPVSWLYWLASSFLSTSTPFNGSSNSSTLQ